MTGAGRVHRTVGCRARGSQTSRAGISQTLRRQLLGTWGAPAVGLSTFLPRAAGVTWDSHSGSGVVGGCGSSPLLL